MMNSIAARSILLRHYTRSKLLRPSSVLAACVLPRNDEFTLHPQNSHSQTRSFHATQRKEILPLVGAVLVFVVARYSYKALRRMDEEWEEYTWALQQYEKQHGRAVNQTGTPLQKATLAVDLGSMYLKLALSSQGKPNILVNRQGFRYTFNGVLHPTQEDAILGQAAFDKMYELRIDDAKKQQVEMPYENHGVIEKVVSPAVKEALEAALGGDSDASNVRTVVTLPLANTADMKDAYLSFMEKATFVPEPVAAVWGAERLGGLLPQQDGGGPFLVVDVGATVVSFSICHKDKLLQHQVTLENVGGEVWSDVIVENLLKGTDLPLQQDGMAMQRLYQAAHTATAEYNSHSQAHVQIPYISMDPSTREPEHLDTNISRSVVEQIVQQHVQDAVATQAQENIFSPHVPQPTDYQSLFTSIMMQLLESTGMTPMDISRVLLVGGGAKQALVEKSFRDAWMGLSGNASALAIPESAVRSELVALGAASLMPHHEYSLEAGLVSK